MTQTIDLSPQVVDLILYAGDGLNIRLTIVDSDDNPVNLSGLIKAQIRLTRESIDPPLAIFTVDLTNAATGIVLLSLTGDQTKLLVGDKKFKGVWDVEWNPTGEQPWTLVQGKVECNRDVTR